MNEIDLSYTCANVNNFELKTEFPDNIFQFVISANPSTHG